MVIKEYFKTPQLSKTVDQLINILSDAISKKKLVRFYYESSSSNKKAWRIVEPYILAIKDKGEGNIFLAGLPIHELSKNIRDRVTGHYLLNKMDTKKLEVLDKTFDAPHVDRKRITNTPTIKIIARYKYPDESK